MALNPLDEIESAIKLQKERVKVLMELERKLAEVENGSDAELTNNLGEQVQILSRLAVAYQYTVGIINGQPGGVPAVLAGGLTKGAN